MYQELRETKTVTIVSGQSLSGAIDLTGLVPIGIELPSDIDSATSITFQNSLDSGSTHVNVYDDADSEYSVTVGTSRYIKFDPSEFLWAINIKVRLGTSGTPVTTTADRTLTLHVRPI